MSNFCRSVWGPKPKKKFCFIILNESDQISNLPLEFFGFFHLSGLLYKLSYDFLYFLIIFNCEGLSKFLFISLDIYKEIIFFCIKFQPGKLNMVK